MADEIKIALQESGLTVYAALRDEDGKVYNTSTGSFEEVDQITWSNADIALSEQGSTGDYYGNMPASLSTAAYTIEVFEQVGASPVRKEDWLITSVGGILGRSGPFRAAHAHAGP